MKVDKALVLHVARLAHLRLSEDEVTYYERQLGKVLDYMDQLQAMPDTLDPMWRQDTLGPSTLEREDVLLPSLAPDVALAAAPQKVGSAFQVPKIIE